MNKYLTYIVIVVVIFISGSVLTTKASAAIIEKQYDRSFQVTENFVKVTETKYINITDPNWLIPAGSKEYFTVFYPVEGDPQASQKITATKDSLKVFDTYGQPLTYSIEETDSKNVIISVAIPEPITSKFPSSVKVEYNAYGLLVKSGAVYDVYVPGFPSDYQTQTERTNEQVTTSVIIPNTLPAINFINPASAIIQKEDNQLITIELEQLKGKTNWIQLGKTQYYQFDIQQEVPKTSHLPLALNFFSLPIPRDIQSGSTSQNVYFTNISPEPYSIEKDIDGNIIATFRLEAHQSHTIHVEGIGIVTEDSSYSITNSGKVSHIDSSLSRYIQPGSFWEVQDPGITAIANQIKGNSTDVYEIINKTYTYIVEKIDYSYVKKYGLNERQGALATLNGGAAVCMEYSDLFITLMRAQGVPARAVFGHGFNSLEYTSRSENTINHQWAEVYLPEKNQWVSIDTTWGEFGNDLVTGDLNHFTSHVASINPETPSTTKITFIGLLQQLAEVKYEVTIKENLSDIDMITTQANTAEDLLSLYNKKQGIDETLDTIGYNASVISKYLTSQLEQQLGIQPQIVLAFIVSVVTVLILLFIRSRVAKRRHVNTNITVNKADIPQTKASNSISAI